MRPTTARIIVTFTVLAAAALGVGIVNSSFHGSFIAGLFIIVLPLLALSYLLPLAIPVRCRKCGGRMRFRFAPRRTARGGEARRDEVYGYVCEGCAAARLWKDDASGSALE